MQLHSPPPQHFSAGTGHWLLASRAFRILITGTSRYPRCTRVLAGWRTGQDAARV
jgi:hypothetical protein